MHLDAVGLPVTYLAPSIYMENLLATAETIREDGVLAAPAGHGRVGFVAAADVAEVAAKVLTSGDHEGATYVLTGPEALTYKDVAARISAVFARQVDYQDQPPKHARELLLGSGLSHWDADGTLELFEWIRHGGEATVTADVRKVTGADPRPVQDWLSKERGSFLDPPPDLPPSAFLQARPRSAGTPGRRVRSAGRVLPRTGRGACA
jgi:uncharacterized protein YbjT (DUF2867 family)